MSITFGTMTEALAALTGTAVTGSSTGFILEGAGGVQTISFGAGAKILKAGGAKLIEVVNPQLGQMGFNPTVGKVWMLNNPSAGAKVAAKVVNLSPGMQAALSNGGAQVGSTTLAPITNMEVVQSTGGNLLQTTTHGILTKIPWNAVMGAVAVAQGVKLGIDFVETNPELATKISNRVFGTNIDPSDIANIVNNTTVWANIRDGAIFITDDIINGVKAVFQEEGVYNQGSSDGLSVKPATFGISEVFFINQYTNGAIWKSYTYNEKIKYILNLTNSSQRFVWVRYKMRTTGGHDYYNYSLVSNYQYSFGKSELVNEGREWTDYPIDNSPADPTANQIFYPTNDYGWLRCFNNSRGSIGAPVGVVTLQLPYNFPIIEGSNSGITAKGLDFLNNGGPTVTPSTAVPGTELITGATYPTTGGTTATDYPDWWGKRNTSLESANDDDSYNHNVWLPINMFDPSSQLDAQDGELKDDEQIVDVIDGIDETIENNPDNDPNADPDTDIYPNPNPQPDPTVDPITPKTPTIDQSDGESPDPTTPILTTVVTSGLSFIYNPTLAQTKQLGRKLWTLDFVENLKKIFVDPMQAIIGMHVLYATPKTGAEQHIVLGFYDTEVNSKIVTNQYVTIDCGTIKVDEYFNDARDYEPYTKVTMYLPFIGVVDIKADDIINSYTNITYHVDVLTGTCLATVQISKGNAKAVLYQFVGNCAVTVPLTTGNYTAVLTALLSVASSAIGGSAIGGVPGALFGGLKGAAINASRAKLNVAQSGALGANAGAMGIRKPYIIIRRPIISDAYGYNMQYGYPANKWMLLGQTSGYTRVRSVHLDNIKCTDEEKEMIETALKDGVVF